MRTWTRAIAQTSRTLGGSIAAVILTSIVIMNSGVAADIATTYEDSCAACHNSGALGAIQKGNDTAWDKLKQQKGMPALVESVKGGMIQMPAGGLCEDCNDEDYRKLIDYMSK